MSWSSLAKASELQKDIERVFATAQIPAKIRLQFRKATVNQVQFVCLGNGHYEFRVNSTAKEKSSTLYWGLHKLGFLFPHPRRQISPTVSFLRSRCGKGWGFRPAFSKRGFHLHTQHPSEWVQGFFMQDIAIVHDTIRWHARNFQNLMQIQMLRGGAEYKLSAVLNQKETLKLLKDLQIYVGIGMSFSSIQQKSFHLISPWKVFVNSMAKAELKNSLEWINKYFPHVAFWTIEMGTSEFTPSPYKSTLEWIQLAGKMAQQFRKRLYIKIHTSTGQKHSKYGNYNYLPKYASRDIGVLPHTTMFYGIEDLVFPMYGRFQIKDMKDFLVEQSKTRPTLYFPETSYFIALDIDVPLFLTSYLDTRAQDLKFLKSTASEGVLTFSTGQEVGYWLFDWTTALMSVENYHADPLAGLRLLKEDLYAWDKILSFQKLHIKGKQVIQSITSSNLMDELPFTKPIHDRNLLKDLRDKPQLLNNEIKNLEEALAELPDISKVQDEELRILLKVTFLRIQHALHLRKALIPKESIPANNLSTLVSDGVYKSTVNTDMELQKAVETRRKARDLMLTITDKYNRYPKSIVFRTAENPTSYKYGYAWPAQNLHYWMREEEIVRNDIKNPFFMNIYNIWEILF